MKRETMDLWVGIFVVLGLLALFFLALKVGNLIEIGEETKTYRIEAHFDNVGGLKPRAPVKTHGVVVGRVENITLGKDLYDAVAVLKLNHNYEFDKDTKASILTSGILGEVYVGLEPGGSEELLHDGDSLSLTQTDSAIVLEKLIGQFMVKQVTESEKK